MPMRIINVAAELAPIAKVGGLADVVYGLSRALISEGQDISVIIPKYSTLKTEYLQGLKQLTDYPSQFEGSEYQNRLWEGVLDGIKVYMIEPRHPRKWFERPSIYNQEDDTERFLYFCRAAFDLIRHKGMAPDVVHLHDWQACALGLLGSTDPATFPRTALTIHNFAHQGICPEGMLNLIGVEGDDVARDLSYPGMANLLKAGIAVCGAVNTVSPTYAEEVLEGHGYGLEEILKKRRDFKGILNGIDFDYWNPETDPLLEANYSLNKLEGRERQRHGLRHIANLEECNRPIIGVITRLVPQKGVELIKQALLDTYEKKAQFVLLGSAPIPEIQREFEMLKESLAGNPHVHIALAYDETLSHQIYGGTDIFLVPSLFEPCGLTQMIALRYGSVPLVRNTGGLADTIIDVDTSGKPLTETNGYVFNNPDPHALKKSLDRALDRWYNQPESWKALQHQGMRQDFSWTQAAKRYLDMYRDI